MHTQSHPVAPTGAFTSASANVCTPKPKAAKLRHPDLPSTGDRTFWLCAWMSDRAKYEALSDFLYATPKSVKLPKDPTLAGALWSAHTLLAQQASTSVKMARDDGLLLFAWADTTMLPA